MPGVPRSKGCSTCRERHIKCDEVRPACTQCLRLGHTCPGYCRSVIFKDEGPRLRRNHRRSTRPAGHNERNEKNREKGSRSNRREAFGDRPLPIDECASPSLVRRCFVNAQPHLFTDFVCRSFPIMYSSSLYRFQKEPTFPHFIMQRFGSKPYLDAAVCCLSSFFLSGLSGNQSLVQTSRQLYTSALTRVSFALDSDEALSEDMLGTLILLAVYEMYSQTTRDAWVYHASAVKELMLNRGAKAHMSGPGRTCYYACRGFLIYASLCKAKSCILDGDEWQKLALVIKQEDSRKPGEWSVYTEVSEDIFMELVKCPRLFSDMQYLSSASSQQEIASLTLRCRATSNRLLKLSEDLWSLITAHNQRQQGVISSSYDFIGPVSLDLPKTAPTILLAGSLNASAMLEDLINTINHNILDMHEVQRSWRLSDKVPSEVRLPLWRIRQASGDGRVCPLSPRSSGASHSTSELELVLPKDHYDSNSLPGPWLDGIVSAMGFLGIKVEENNGKD